VHGVLRKVPRLQSEVERRWKLDILAIGCVVDGEVVTGVLVRLAVQDNRALLPIDQQVERNSGRGIARPLVLAVLFGLAEVTSTTRSTLSVGIHDS
jgi:hypothetical protein